MSFGDGREPLGPGRGSEPADLNDRRLRFERLAEAGSWAWNVADDRVVWSDELYRIWDVDPDDFEATYDAVLTRVHPDDRASLSDAVARALEAHEPYTLEHRILDRDGQARWLRARGDVLLDAQGTVVRLHGTCRDIGELRDARATADQAVAQLRMLERVARALAPDDLDLPRAVEIAARELSSLTGCPLARAWHIENARHLSLIGAWAIDTGGGQCVELSDPDVGGAPPSPSGLARRVARSGAAEWTSLSVEELPGGTMRHAALTLRGAMAVPIRHERRVLAVIEMFASEELAPPDSLLTTASALSAMLARFAPSPAAEELAGPASGSTASSGTDRESATAVAGLLGGALERGEFLLAYQPQISLESDRVVAAEALLRWNRPDGLVSPMAFIPIAEATGDIVSIGSWVLRRACDQAARWKQSFPGLRPWHVSVNVSARQFRADLVETVGAALTASGLEPATLRLELTETTLIEDVEFARSVLAELRELGVSLALDDFGTGYSSLAYFRHFALDEVKIDRTFVKGLGVNRGDNAIVASVLSLAHALDRTVVAEGVETRAQVEHLRSLGCDRVQGFLFGRPMPAEELGRLLAHSSSGGRLLPEQADDLRAPRLQSVLIVDDSPVVRQLARMSLTAAGFGVEETGTGSGGLALATRSNPDCVLLDMNLPDIDGLRVCESLRQDPRTADSAIIVLTAAAEHTTKADAFTAGADDYIVKPFIPRDLVARVHAAVRRRETG